MSYFLRVYLELPTLWANILLTADTKILVCNWVYLLCLDMLGQLSTVWSAAHIRDGDSLLTSCIHPCFMDLLVMVSTLLFDAIPAYQKFRQKHLCF